MSPDSRFMRSIRCGLVLLWGLCGPGASAIAQVSVGTGLPAVSIGINLPVFPDLVRVRGYPLYYGWLLDVNLFFYDGMYWVFRSDNWYASTWYNGPWTSVDRETVPPFILRIPVRYYKNPPAYFRGWQADEPPRWGQRWGSEWAQRRSGWDRWDRSAAPAPAPLPVYQERYPADRYPSREQQRALHERNYRYLPGDPLVQRLNPQAKPAPEVSHLHPNRGAPPQRGSGGRGARRLLA